MVLRENISIALAGGFWLRRAKVMDRYRLEVVGAGSQRAMFQVPSAVLAKWPAQTTLPAAA